MADKTFIERTTGFIRRLWTGFWSPTGVLSLGFLLILGFVGGVLFWGGFHWALELTNTEKFCISCHTMERNYDEYTETVHYNNHSGVRATCPDCHVPKEWQHKIKAKIMASKDLYHEILGTIATEEAYEAHRLKMAASTWKKMKESDSRECRNCHDFEYMDFTIQETRAADEHQRALDEGKTCVDCHQGIAHNLPAGYLEKYEEVVQELAAAEETLPVKSSGLIDVEALAAPVRAFLGSSASQ
jgi:cytochrome c-type protein NapC